MHFLIFINLLNILLNDPLIKVEHRFIIQVTSLLINAGFHLSKVSSLLTKVNSPPTKVHLYFIKAVQQIIKVSYPPIIKLVRHPFEVLLFKFFLPIEPGQLR